MRVLWRISGPARQRPGGWDSTSGTTCAVAGANCCCSICCLPRSRWCCSVPWQRGYSTGLSPAAVSALGNFDIAVFLLSPSRLVLALVATSLFVAIASMRMGGMLLIGYAAGDGQRLPLMQPLRIVLRRIVSVVALSLVLLASLLLLLLPFLAGAGLVARSLLTEHDINFYLEFRPFEFWLAVGLGSVLGMIAAGVIAAGLLRVVFSLPNLLLEHVGVLPALSRSWRQTRGRRIRILVALLIWFLSWTLVFSLVNLALHLAADWLVGLAADRVRLLVLTLGAIAVVSLAINFMLGFFYEATACLLVVRLFRDAGGMASLAGAGEGCGVREHRAFTAMARRLPLLIVLAGMVLMMLVVRSLLQQVQWARSRRSECPPGQFARGAGEHAECRPASSAGWCHLR